jgi:radical SAM superfamily enzyme YgiQ (UPF0313 family)
MRVLLVEPGVGKDTSRLAIPGYHEPLALETIAACLQQHEVKILDMRLDNNLDEAVRRFSPQACGITCTYAIGLNRGVKAALRVKALDPRIFVFIGGVTATLSPQDLYLACVDAVVLGEGEQTAPELLAALEAGGDLRQVPGVLLNHPEGQVATPARARLADLDQSPLPARSQFWPSIPREVREGHGAKTFLPVVETARGCPYKCKFCVVSTFHGRRVRLKSPQRVVQEVASIPHNIVYFADDDFFAVPRHALEIAQLLKTSGVDRKHYYMFARTDSVVRNPDLLEAWQEVASLEFALGIEAIDDTGLDYLNKRSSEETNLKAVEILRARGVRAICSMLVLPAAELTDFRRLRRYVIERQFLNPHFYVLTPGPGSPLWEEHKGQVLYPDYDLFDGYHAVIPTRLPLRRFYQELARLYAPAPCSGLAARLRRTAGTLLRRVGILPPDSVRDLRKAETYLRAHRHSFPRSVHGYRKEPLPTPSGKAKPRLVSG